MTVISFPARALPDPNDVARALTARRTAIRQAIAAEAERLIGWLDVIDGDADLEAEEDFEHDGREPEAPTIMGSHAP